LPDRRDENPGTGEAASLPARPGRVTRLFLAAAQLLVQLGNLQFQVPDLGFQLENAADGGQRHAFAGEPDHVLDGDDLPPGVPALPATGTRGPYHAELVEAAQKRLLHFEHSGHLSHREQGQGLVLKWQ